MADVCNVNESSITIILERITSRVRKPLPLVLIQLLLRNCANEETLYADEIDNRDVDGYENDELP